MAILGASSADDCVVERLAALYDAGVLKRRELEIQIEQLQAAIDKAHGAMRASGYVGGPTEREAWQTAMQALGPLVTEHKGQGR